MWIWPTLLRVRLYQLVLGIYWATAVRPPYALLSGFTDGDASVKLPCRVRTSHRHQILALLARDLPPTQYNVSNQDQPYRVNQPCHTRPLEYVPDLHVTWQLMSSSHRHFRLRLRCTGPLPCPLRFRACQCLVDRNKQVRTSEPTKYSG